MGGMSRGAGAGLFAGVGLRVLGVSICARSAAILALAARIVARPVAKPLA